MNIVKPLVYSVSASIPPVMGVGINNIFLSPKFDAQETVEYLEDLYGGCKFWISENYGSKWGYYPKELNNPSLLQELAYEPLSPSIAQECRKNPGQVVPIIRSTTGWLIDTRVFRSFDSPSSEYRNFDWTKRSNSIYSVLSSRETFKLPSDDDWKFLLSKYLTSETKEDLLPRNLLYWKGDVFKLFKDTCTELLLKDFSGVWTKDYLNARRWCRKPVYVKDLYSPLKPEVNKERVEKHQQKDPNFLSALISWWPEFKEKSPLKVVQKSCSYLQTLPSYHKDFNKELYFFPTYCLVSLNSSFVY